MADTLQLDLFGEVEAAHTRRLTDALICLRDGVPDAMEVVVHLAPWWSREDRGPRASGDWAYSIRNVGVRYERRDEWSAGGGWTRTPAHLVTWAELADLLSNDPRRPAVTEWFNSLTEPDRWLDWIRPHELWPDAETWHPSYAEGDHERPGWDARLVAWQQVQTILTDAIAALGGDGS